MKPHDLPLARTITIEQDPILVTHRNCLDGTACQMIWKNSFGKAGNRIFTINPSDVDDFVTKCVPTLNGFIVFADVGHMKPSSAEALNARSNVVVIDHHQTSAALQKYPWAWVDTDGPSGSACGALMLYQYLCRWDEYPHVKALALAVDEHDRWTRQDGLGEDLACLHSFLGSEGFQAQIKSRSLYSRYQNQGEWLNDTEKTMVAAVRAQRRAATERLLPKVRGLKYHHPRYADQPVTLAIVVADTVSVSETLHEVLQAHPEADIAVLVNVGGGFVSLRSRPGGANCAKLAEVFGGGGHHVAAGFPLPQSTTDDVINRALSR